MLNGAEVSSVGRSSHLCFQMFRIVPHEFAFLSSKYLFLLRLPPLMKSLVFLGKGMPSHTIILLPNMSFYWWSNHHSDPRVLVQVLLTRELAYWRAGVLAAQWDWKFWKSILRTEPCSVQSIVVLISDLSSPDQSPKWLRSLQYQKGC